MSKTVKTAKNVKLPLTDAEKKSILDVVLQTPNIEFDAAKTKYINSLRDYIEELDKCDNIEAFKKIQKVESNFIMFDYDKAIGELLNQNITITKKDLKKYVQLI